MVIKKCTRNEGCKYKDMPTFKLNKQIRTVIKDMILEQRIKMLQEFKYKMGEKIINLKITAWQSIVNSKTNTKMEEEMQTLKY